MGHAGLTRAEDNDTRFVVQVAHEILVHHLTYTFLRGRMAEHETGRDLYDDTCMAYVKPIHW